MAGLEGIRYLRTSRGESKVIYGPDEEFPVGGSKVLRSSDADRLTVVAAASPCTRRSPRPTRSERTASRSG